MIAVNLFRAANDVRRQQSASRIRPRGRRRAIVFVLALTTHLGVAGLRAHGPRSGWHKPRSHRVAGVRAYGPNAIVYFNLGTLENGTPGPTEQYNGNPYGTVIEWTYSSDLNHSVGDLVIDSPNAYGGNIRDYADPNDGGFSSTGFDIGSTLSRYAVGVPAESGQLVYTLLSGPTTFYAPAPTTKDTVGFGYLGPDGPHPPGPPTHPVLPPGKDAYTVALGGNTVAETDAGFFNAPANAGITFTLGGTYTSTVLAKLEGQSITLTGSGTFTTPKLVVAGNVNVTGGTLHGDQFFVDDASNTAATTTTLTLTGANARLEAPTFLTMGFATTGASTLALKNGASGTAGPIYLGTGGAGSMGVLTLDNATLVSNSFLLVGDAADSQGTVTLTNGGALTTTDAAIGFGGGVNASSVTVDGSSSKWTAKGYIEVGANGPTDTTHQLIVRNGGTVASEGYLVVGGVSGNSGGTGRLSILGGGKVTSGTLLASPALAAAVGFGDHSAGSVTIDGTGSTWDIKQRLNVGFGDGSTGLVTVQNGGVLQVEGDFIRLGRLTTSTGTLTFDKAGGANPAMTFTGGNLISRFLLVGDQGAGTVNVQGGAQITTDANVLVGANNAMSQGQVTVKGQSSAWTINGDLVVGDQGKGTFAIQNGNTVTVGGSAVLGRQSGGQGTLTLDGAGSKLTLTDANQTLQIGTDGSGTLVVRNGASVDLPATALGTVSGGSGNINVVGGGTGRATVNVAGDLLVGQASGGTGDGTGTPGGSLGITGGGLVAITGNVFVGDNSGSFGKVQISGTNSELRLGDTGILFVGAQNGSGQLTLDTSATLKVAQLTVGQSRPGANAPANIVNLVGVSSGTQTQLTTTGKLEVGTSGTGALNLSAGAQLTTGGIAYLGVNQSGVGTVTITDPNTRWDATAQGIVVAQDGTATLNIRNGATVTTNDVTLSLRSGSGTLTVTGANSKLDLAADRFNFGEGLSSRSATLNVQAGGDVEVGTLALGARSVALTVDGRDSQGNRPSMLNASFLEVNSGIATAALTVSGGGQFNVTNPGTLMLTPTGNANLTVRDQGSVLAAPQVSLRVGGGDNVTVTGDFLGGATVDTGDATISGAHASVAVGGTPEATTTWTVHPGGTSVLTLNSGGELFVNGGGTVAVQGLTTVYGTGSTLTVGNSANAPARFGTVGLEVNGGVLDVRAGGQVSSTGTTFTGDAFTVDNGGKITLSESGGTLSGASLSLQSGGQLVATAGTANLGGRVSVGTGGVLDVSGGGSLNAGFVLNQAGSGQISVGAGGSLKNFGNVYASQINIGLGGTVGGPGSFNGAVINGGKVIPGDPQTMTINGNYTQTSGGLLEIAIAGADPSQMDHLVVTGIASVLNGSELQLDFIAGFAPKQGEIFEFLSAASLDPNNHTFGNVDITGLAPGFQYSVQPDPNNPGNYELMALNDGISTTVPEPGTWAGVFLGAGGLLLGALRRRRGVKARAFSLQGG